MRVFLRSSMFEPVWEPLLWTHLCKAGSMSGGRHQRGESYRRFGASPEEKTRRTIAPVSSVTSWAEQKKERAPTVDAPQQKIAAPVPSHLEKVSTPHHQAAEAQAIMRMSTHEYHRTGDVRHSLRAQRAQQHLNHFAAQGITPTAQHHADWVDHYAQHGDKYGKSPVSAMTRARWHRIAGGIEFSGHEHEHEPEWTEAQSEAHLARLRPKEEPPPATDLPFVRPPHVSRPKVRETLGYERKIYAKSLINLLLMKAYSLDLYCGDKE